MRANAATGVLLVSSIAGMGGAEFSLFELATHITQARFRMHLLVSGSGQLTESFERAGLPIERGEFPFFSRRRPWIYWQSVWRIVALVRRHQVGLIHVNCDRAVPHAVAAARLARIPCVCYIHDLLRAWYLPRYVRYLNASSAIVADSRATEAKCRRAGMDPAKLEVIYECIEMDRFTAAGDEERTAFRKEFGLQPDQVAIGLVGQVLAGKGHGEFLEAARAVIAKFPSAVFFVVGDDRMSVDPSFGPRLLAQAREPDLSKHVIFTGFRSDIPRVMAGLDIVAVPSWHEALGRVAIEALAAGRPVVASDVEGLPEVVQDGATGFLVPAKAPAILAERLLRLCSEPALRAAMGQRGPASAEKFDVKHHVAQFEHLYSRLVRSA